MKRYLIVILLCMVITGITGCSTNIEPNLNHGMDTKSSLTSSASDSASLSSSSPVFFSDVSPELEVMDEDEVIKQVIKLKFNSLNKQVVKSTIKKISQSYEGDLLCTVDNYELHLRTVGSFSGDTYEFGVFDKITDSWVVPYSNEYKIINEFINTQIFLEKRHGAVTFYDLGNNIIYIKEYITTWGYDHGDWCYDFLNDRLVRLDDEPVKYYDNKIITGTHTSVPKVYDFQTKITKNFIELPNDLSYKYYFQKTFYNSILIEKAKKARYGYELECYQLYDFDGNLLFDLSEYSLPYDYLGKASYNKDKFFFVAKGKDSGIYACLIDQDGVLLFDPIKLQDENGRSFKIYLLDDCAVISLIFYKKGDYGTYTSTIETITNIFYDFDGTELFRYDE